MLYHVILLNIENSPLKSILLISNIYKMPDTFTEKLSLQFNKWFKNLIKTDLFLRTFVYKSSNQIIFSQQLNRNFYGIMLKLMASVKSSIARDHRLSWKMKVD